jgi:hypothetical protein
MHTTIVLRYQCGYIKASGFFESELFSSVLEDTCLKDPRAFWGLSSDLFPEKQRGDADGPWGCLLGSPYPLGVEGGKYLTMQYGYKRLVVSEGWEELTTKATTCC